MLCSCFTCISIHLVAEPTENYTYIVGIDTIEPILYCDPTQNVLLHNTAWSREGVNATNLSNPLNIRENSAELVGVNRTLICTHLLDGIIQLTTSVLVQGKGRDVTNQCFRGG